VRITITFDPEVEQSGGSRYGLNVVHPQDKAVVLLSACLANGRSGWR
jgi:hypothetical protein